jgi:hypothetical protein
MSPDGTWNVTMNTPMGAQAGTLTLKSNGGSLEGELNGAQGAAAIEDGKIDGNTLSWAVTAQQLAMKINFTATVEGDTISGEAELGTFGKATFEGTRA